MAVTIAGIRVNDVHLEPNGETLTATGFKIKSAEYSLIGSTGKVLAKQTIGGYQGIVLEPSLATQKALDEFWRSYVNDVQTLLGLLE